MRQDHIQVLALGKFKGDYVLRVEQILELATGVDVLITRVKGNDNVWTDDELDRAWAKASAESQFHFGSKADLDGIMLKNGAAQVKQLTNYVADLSHNEELNTVLLSWGWHDSEHVYTISPNPSSDIDLATVLHWWL